MPKITVDDIINFEKHVFKMYKKGRIKYPIHLRSGRENQLIQFFKKQKIRKRDPVYAYWDSHDICLCKGVSRKDLLKAILNGSSIALSFPEYNILCSGIAGSLMGVAVGHAWAIKAKGGDQRVYLFCGDMSAEMGIFHEAIKYSYNFELPIKFVVSDNNLSVMTPTRDVWGSDYAWYLDSPYKEYVMYLQYTNGYPHSGIGKKVRF